MQQLTNTHRVLLRRRREKTLRRQHQRAALAAESFEGGRHLQHANGKQPQPGVGRYVELLQSRKPAQLLRQREHMLRLQVIARHENGLHGCCRLRVRQAQSHRINAGAQRGLPACLAAAFETADSTSRWSHSALQSSVAAGAADIRRSCLLRAAWKGKGEM